MTVDAMPPQDSHHEERRLTTILAADVAGYSRLMAADEVGTHAQLKAHRKELIEPKTAEHQGRVVKLIGDGTLMEFASAVNAVRFAADIQRAMEKRNEDVPEEQRVTYRIGINIGDIIVDGDDIYGDGVNIAARLQDLAAPCEVVVSRNVYDQVRAKVDITFEDLGDRKVKNIPEPVRVYRLRPPNGETAGAEAHASGLALPEKPSIAVLAFANMSADPEQDYFSDGIAEDIITELSKFRWLFVIARNSSFAFKGAALGVKEVSRQLGVRYMVEGSVRRAGERLRITAQLIDAVSDTHLWAEHYDREIADIFAVQDEVTQAIVSAIEPELASAERGRARRKPPGNLDAWACFQRGLWHLYRYRAEDSARAQDLFRRAIALDPTFGPAHAALAYALYYEVIEGLVSAPDGRLPRALAAAKAAVTLDERDAFGHMVLGRVLLADGDVEASIAACETALEFNPNDANAHYGLGLARAFAGDPAAAIPEVDEALRLSPHDPGCWAFFWLRSHALMLLGENEEALAWIRKSVRQPNATLWVFAGEAAVLAHLGRADEARAALGRALAIRPSLSAGFFRTVLPWRDPAQLERYLDGLRTAGLEGCD